MWWPEPATSFCRFWLLSYGMDPAVWLAWVCGSWILKTQDCHQYDTARKSCLQSIKSKKWFQHVCWKTPVVQNRIWKRLHAAICCKLEFSWIIQGVLQVRINHFESSTVITLSLDQDLPPATCLRQKASIVANLLSSIVHENRVRSISAIVLLSIKMPKKNYTYIIQIRSRPS